MKAGRELDALIAEKVMGWKATHKDERHLWFNEGKPSPPTRFCAEEDFGDNPFWWSPSRSIADAWLVVEKLGKRFDVSRCRAYQEIEAWFWEASFHNGPDAQAATVPLAICLAALKAIA